MMKLAPPSTAKASPPSARSVHPTSEISRPVSDRPARLARTVVRKMDPGTVYRVVIAHANNEAGAQATRHAILQRHGRIHSCHITEAGPALGVHFGPGGLIAGFTPQPRVLN